MSGLSIFIITEDLKLEKKLLTDGKKVLNPSKIGINNIEELSKIKHYELREKLDTYGRQHGEISKQIVLQAKAQATNKAIRLKPDSLKNNFQKYKS